MALFRLSLLFSKSSKSNRSSDVVSSCWCLLQSCDVALLHLALHPWRSSRTGISSELLPISLACRRQSSVAHLTKSETNSCRSLARWTFRRAQMHGCLLPARTSPSAAPKPKMCACFFAFRSDHCTMLRHLRVPRANGRDSSPLLPSPLLAPCAQGASHAVMAVTASSYHQTSTGGACSEAANAAIVMWRGVDEWGPWLGSTLAPLLCPTTKGPPIVCTPPHLFNLTPLLFVHRQLSLTTKIAPCSSAHTNYQQRATNVATTATSLEVSQVTSRHLTSPHLTSPLCLLFTTPSVCLALPKTTFPFPTSILPLIAPS